MGIMKVGRNTETGTVTVEQVDTGERRLSASERERLALLKKQAEADRPKTADEALVHPGTEESPAVVTTGDAKTAEQEYARQEAARRERTDPAAQQEEEDIAALVEAGQGPTSDDELVDETTPAVATETEPTEEQEPKKAFPCPHCEFPARTQEGLDRHIETRHPETLS